MANSSDVNAGDQILAAHQNNIRLDIFDLTTGHDHDGTDSKTLATDSVDTAQIIALAVDTAELANDAVDKTKIAADIAGDGLLQAGDGSLEVNDDNSTLEISGDILRVKSDGITANELANDSVHANTMASTASYSSAQIRYYVIDPGDININQATTDGTSGWQVQTATNDYAAIHLPNGAIVTSLKVYVYTSDTSTATYIMSRNDLDSSTQDTMATVSPGGSAGFRNAEDTSISNATIEVVETSPIIPKNGYVVSLSTPVTSTPFIYTLFVLTSTKRLAVP